MTIQYTPGKGVISKFIVRTWHNTTFDMANLCHMFSYYESIFSSAISSQIGIIDGMAAVTSLPIVGGEIVNVVAGSPGDKTNLDLRMILYKMDNRRRQKPDLETYDLFMTTKEMLIDHTLLIDTAYSSRVSDIVQKIVDTYITPQTGKKLITLEESSGLFNYVPCKVSPFTAIQYLTDEAQSSENPNSNYVFFENLDGYHFVTIDRLYAAAPARTIKQDEQVVSPAAAGRSPMELSNIITQLNHDDSFDILNGQITGQFSNRTLSYDPLSKSMDASVYNYADEKAAKNSHHTISSDAYNAIASIPTREKFVITNEHRSNMSYIKDHEPSAASIYRRRQDTASQGLATMKQFGGIRIHIRIPGNAAIRAGSTINVVIPSPDNTEQGKKQNDKFLTGKYLVTSVAQRIDMNSSEFATVIECMRKSYQESI